MEDVVIVGAGPTGLMLACELRLAGTRARVLEQLPKPTGLSKALALTGRAVDLLDCRGLLERFQAHQPVETMSIAGLFHFGGIPIDVQRLKPIPPKFLFVLQAVTEQLLAERADELGVEICRGRELTGLEQPRARRARSASRFARDRASQTRRVTDFRAGSLLRYPSCGRDRNSDQQAS